MNPIALHRGFLLRQLTRINSQAVVFLLCVTLAVVSLVAVGGFKGSVNDAFIRDASILQGGDIVARSHQPFSAGLMDAVSMLDRAGGIERVRTWEFYSVARSPATGESTLARLKVVEAGYPLYGRVVLQSGKRLAEVLGSGRVVVERGILDRLRIAIGDSLQLGRANLTIADVVLEEPDRPMNFFTLGPRIFVSAADLKRLDLVKPGSRVHYGLLIRVGRDRNTETVLKTLQDAALPDQEQVHDYRHAGSRLKRFFDNFFFFLSLISIFTLLLAGIGIAGTLGAYIRDQQDTIAILKSLGATNRFIYRQYLSAIAVFGLFGSFCGLGLGVLLQFYLPKLFQAMLPPGLEMSLSYTAIFEGLLHGWVVVALFTLLPLDRIKEVKPSIILRKETLPSGMGRFQSIVVILILAYFTAMIFRQLRDVSTGIYFVGGIVLQIVVTAAIAKIILWMIHRLHPPWLPLRQAIRGLFRPRNATLGIVVTLSAALTVIYALYLIEQNLDASFIRSYPQDSPNLFFLDIQPDQKNEFKQIVGEKAPLYPVVRARLLSINGTAIDRNRPARRMRDRLTRMFNLTYRNELLPGESVISGKQMFKTDWQGPQVSVLDTVREMHPMEVGDRLTFKIHGIKLEARISSIRSHQRESFQPFFYFVFEPETLQKAPQTVFSALRLTDKNRTRRLRNELARRLPNVSMVDASQTLAAASRMMAKFSAIIRFFTAFGIFAGLLMIVSSLLATRWARTREATYFKILGARGRFVMLIFSLENALVGMICALLAVGVSQTVSMVLCRHIFNIRYWFFPVSSLVLISATVLLVVAVGSLASVWVLKRKPMRVLREQTLE